MPESAPSSPSEPLTSPKVRDRLVNALNLDLIGPWSDHRLAKEQLPESVRPSSWYLAGFIVPAGASPEERADPDADETAEGTPQTGGNTEESTEEERPARREFFPSSVGLSFLVPEGVASLEVTVRWGDYREDTGVDSKGETVAAFWQRHPRVRPMPVPIPAESRTHDIPDSGGLRLCIAKRPIAPHHPESISRGTQSVSVFVVNQREADPDNPDPAYAFQVGIEVRCDRPFVPRPDMRGSAKGDWDERLAELHYSDSPEYAAGHGVSADWEIVDGECRLIRTAWIPGAVVEKTETAEVEGAVLSMDELGALADAKSAKAALAPLVSGYRAWIKGQHRRVETLPGERKKTAKEVLRLAKIAADRIGRGIEALADEDVLDAFRVANRAVAAALRQRLRKEFAGRAPRWRAFQLAFILLNLPGLADPADPGRENVDLLFFPTGGGKTEAYLGLAAFTMVLRRLRHPGNDGLDGAGVTVVMRYTLRLLTLDQLARASGLVCALELERVEHPERYGRWPFEIGLWVGSDTTPNYLGTRNDGSERSARTRVLKYRADHLSEPMPIPLGNCPWCGTGLGPSSFALSPNDDRPKELTICCPNFECEFSDRPLPIQVVDETVYRRLPSFLIATVDKFAALPWVAEAGKLLGRAERHDDLGFYGPEEPGKGEPLGSGLLPPDLVIQDELHLISGPLGTMVGLYEASIGALCERDAGGRTVRPKIIASTATVRRAQDQIQALFARASTQVFPPPGPDRRDSFFARMVDTETAPGRVYIGIAAPGRGVKEVYRRVWLALMGAAQLAYDEEGGDGNPANPADPYMTVLGYFNNLRELGNARRILEEQVHSTARRYGQRLRIGEQRGLFADREKFSDVVELTSRVPTSEVAAARLRLGLRFREKDRVDSALATNMISVGLDITRLGLMVVTGQPKTHAEYIQATSRVGRDDKRPGLVVTLLSMMRPRDRSHYERFRHYHETFYRSVEVSSVTPFSARALDRGFAGALVGLARHSDPRLTPPQGVGKLAEAREDIEGRVRKAYCDRAASQPDASGSETEERLRSVRRRVSDLLDAWEAVVSDYEEKTVTVHYHKRERRGVRSKPLLRDMLEREFEADHHRKFRANRAMRNVEPGVDLFLKTLTGLDVEKAQ